MNWYVRCAVLLVMLALFGCTASGQTRYAPYPPDNSRNLQEHGGGDGGGGGGGM
jgi:hypothetical protein